MILLRHLFGFICCFIIGATPAYGQNFLQKLLTKSPGPLSQPHEEYDNVKGCVSCHVKRLGGEVDIEKCFSCHPGIEQRFQAQLGYHKDKPDCETCHAEHKGRDNFIFAPEDWLDDFDHSEVDYVLLGKHAEIECLDCHTEVRRHYKTKKGTKSVSYLNAPSNCVDCHEKDYAHNFKEDALLECTQCHSTNIEDWKTLRDKMPFDHDSTDYPLKGVHVIVDCNECHIPDQKLKRVTEFAPLPFNECTDCHNDPHRGKFGNDCTGCHSVYRKWTNLITPKDATGKGLIKKGFNHSKTNFPLTGYHEAVDCKQCHFDPKAKYELSKNQYDQCSDCHGLAHKNQFTDKNCEDCHDTDRRYEDSKYELSQHNKLQFALTGKHQVIDCNKCHFDGNYEGIQFGDCQDCHRNPHDKREIEQSCDFCHTTTSFSWIDFEHNKKTNFRITGKHVDLACLSCHTDESFKDMPATNQNPNCQGCHQDPHGPSMDNDCQSCHRTEGFELTREFDHRELGKWELTGKHADLSCQKCHADHLAQNYSVTRSSKLKATDCANCHLDVHDDAYGSNCQSCHNTDTFSLEHGTQTHNLGYFRLEGQHDNLDCIDCHRPETQLQGQGAYCGSCHEKNDSHLGKFSNQCGDCHNQLEWRPANFRHNLTAFRLTGAHRYVECSSCHVNQIYQGLPSDCYFCHSDSHLSSVGFHSPGTPQECSSCHSSISWAIRKGSGIQ